ncbi:16S rRNA (cytosine(1402)-N(4))-methyltransferase [Novacetimonas maltaceti]|nr:16S rRNA (cytosine(1402)-N(4))-methyltransferase RsmH [Novacetimonas maltaceti]PYD61921.1 16S rRNA (cytosine(1402)-N(4))-methyltransferase [Novacetimonas maltaceti]
MASPPPASLPGTDGGHVPVMLDEVLCDLAPRDGATYLDGTFGGGGYARAILSAADCTLWAIDRDPAAIARGNAQAASFPDGNGGSRLRMIKGGFGDMASLLAARGVTALDGVTLDLGVSSYQIDQAERGFSFRMDGPLDMRMGDEGTTAADVVNRYQESELADIIYTYGEERMSRRVARAIVAARAEEAITTTARLADIVRSVVRADRSGIDPATRTFQGLRIHVNDELGQIERGLDQALGLLAPGGRLVVVSFHSLEDRLVKLALNRAAGRMPGPSRHDPGAAVQRTQRPAFRLVRNKAIRPSDAECHRNPRARSARLRTVERVTTFPPTESATDMGQQQ